MAAFAQSESRSDDSDEDLIALLLTGDSDEDDFGGFELQAPSEIINCRQRSVEAIDQFYNDRNFESDTLFGWSREDGDNIMAPFTADPGIKYPVPDDPDALDFFNLLFEPEMWDILVRETNRYAETRQTDGVFLPSSRMNAWREVTVDEMKTFIALVLATGLVKKDDIELYWTTDDVMETPFFRDIMSKNRFLNILGNLHLSDNQAQRTNDPLAKVRPFITMLSTFRDAYVPEKELSFDEAICPFKGRVGFKVYNPMKPHKFGIKIYQVCEASSGYCINFRVYQGKGHVDVTMAELSNCPDDLTLTSKTVLGLLASSGLLHQGYHVYMDNYYTSPELYEELDVNDTYACGTVRVNRQNVPEAFKKGIVKLGAQDSIFRKKGNMLALKYHDKRDVYMLSTIHKAALSVTNKNDLSGNAIVKPTCIIDYIQNMGGVDTNDQLVQYYQCFRKTVKWWRKLFFHFLNLLVCNAYILSQKYGLNFGKRSHQKFRSSLVRLLIQSAPNAPRPQKQGRKSEVIDRLRARHFPAFNKAKVDAKRAKPMRDCVVCNSNRDGHKRKQTVYCCEPCNVALCVPLCFQLYHTQQDYKRAFRALQSDD